VLTVEQIVPHRYFDIFLETAPVRSGANLKRRKVRAARVLNRPCRLASQVLFEDPDSIPLLVFNSPAELGSDTAFVKGMSNSNAWVAAVSVSAFNSILSPNPGGSCGLKTAASSNGEPVCRILNSEQTPKDARPPRIRAQIPRIPENPFVGRLKHKAGSLGCVKSVRLMADKHHGFS
jgi:hypothetical protein